MNKFNTDTWGFTHININKSDYLWSIKNYSCIAMENGKKLESPTFSLDSEPNKKYCIAVWPNGSYELSDYIAMSFCNKSSTPIDVEFCISILDKQGNKLIKNKKRTRIDANGFNGFNNFERKSFLNEENGLLVNDVITFFCEYSIITGSLSSAISIYPTLRLKTKTLDAFEQQLDTEEFSDFTIVASCGKKLYTHKFILAAQSPVFLAMIKNNMKENANKTVYIIDIEYGVLKEMLRFMYAAKVENLDNIVYELVAAADKYQIDGLKELCERYFFNNIKHENMKEILDVARRYKLEILKEHVHKYLVCHSKSLFDNIGFDSDENINVIVETLYKLKFEKK